jgi:hypothetical protein
MGHPKAPRRRVGLYTFVAMGMLLTVRAAMIRHQPMVADQGLVYEMEGDDLLERRMKSLAPHAINCGRVEMSGDPHSATECAIVAFRAQKAFRVRFEMADTDPEVAISLTGTNDGRVTTLLFHGDPDGRVVPSLITQSVSERPCPSPVELLQSPGGRLNCFPPDPSPNGSERWPSVKAY